MQRQLHTLETRKTRLEQRCAEQTNEIKDRDKRIKVLEQELSYATDEQDRLKRLNEGLRNQIEDARKSGFTYKLPARKKSRWSP